MMWYMKWYIYIYICIYSVKNFHGNVPHDFYFVFMYVEKVTVVCVCHSAEKASLARSLCNPVAANQRHLLQWWILFLSDGGQKVAPLQRHHCSRAATDGRSQMLVAAANICGGGPSWQMKRAILCVQSENGRKRSLNDWTLSCKLFTEMTQPRRFVQSGEKLHVLIAVSSLVCSLGGTHLFLCAELGRRNTSRGRFCYSLHNKKRWARRNVKVGGDFISVFPFVSPPHIIWCKKWSL